MEAEQEIQARIAEVEAEQHRLRIRSVEVHGLDAEERARLKALRAAHSRKRRDGDG